VILDSGALIGVERHSRAMMARLLAAQLEGEELRTHAMVVAQVWREAGGRQGVLARLLRSVVVVSIDEALGRRAGELLGRSNRSDPIDAAVVLIARDGEVVLTSDPEDLRPLAAAAGRSIHIVSW
jgi:hypothetical protein